MKQLLKDTILSFVGGALYIVIELLWRGHSHWTMFVLGGICFFYVGLINEELPWEMSLIKQMLIGAVVITMLELLFGVIVNGVYKLNVWDYSNIQFNFLGQICLPYSILWFFISLPAIVLDDYLRYRLFHEEKPRYRFLGGKQDG